MVDKTDKREHKLQQIIRLTRGTQITTYLQHTRGTQITTYLHTMVDKTDKRNTNYNIFTYNGG